MTKKPLVARTERANDPFWPGQMSQYRKRPVVIEAVQFTQEILEAHLFDGVPLPAGLRMGSGNFHPGDRKIWSANIYIDTLESHGDSHKVSVGDWIITGVKGEKYACKPDIFTATYEPASALSDRAPSRAEVLEEARLAYEAHTFNPSLGNEDICRYCCSNVRNQLHLRSGEQRKDRIAALKNAAPRENGNSGKGKGHALPEPSASPPVAAARSILDLPDDEAKAALCRNLAAPANAAPPKSGVWIPISTPPTEKGWYGILDADDEPRAAMYLPKQGWVHQAVGPLKGWCHFPPSERPSPDKGESNV